MCSAAIGQQSTGMIKGTIIDKETGEPIPFANVIIDMENKIGAVSDMDGRFTIKNLAPGKYDVTFKYIGYETRIYEDVKVEADRITFLDGDVTMLEQQIEVLKPVIYMYSNEVINGSISLNTEYDKMFTYPKYDIESGWKFTVDVNGIKVDGQSYNYLFWEALTNDYSKVGHAMNEGFCVAGDSAITFLEPMLDHLGFNQAEKVDFITFWGPQIAKNKWSQVHFKVDEAYDDVMKMDVSPQPDAMRRVFMTLTPIDKPVELKEQVFTEFERSGFTLLEWGGAVVPQPSN